MKDDKLIFSAARQAFSSPDFKIQLTNLGDQFKAEAADYRKNRFFSYNADVKRLIKTKNFSEITAFFANPEKKFLLNTTFFCACESGSSIETVELLLDLGADLKFNSFKCSLAGNNPAVINLLLAKKPKFLRKTDQLILFVQEAMEYAAMDSLQVLFANILSSGNPTLLKQYVMLLNALGIDVLESVIDQETYREAAASPWFLFTYLIKWCAPAFIDYFLNNYQQNIQTWYDHEGKNFFHFVVSQRRPPQSLEILDILLNRLGAKLCSWRDNRLLSPLQFAMIEGNLPVARFLMDRLSKPLEFINLPLIQDIVEKDHVHIFEYLFEHYHKLSKIPSRIMEWIVSYNSLGILHFYEKNNINIIGEYQPIDNFGSENLNLFHLAAQNASSLSLPLMQSLYKYRPQDFDEKSSEDGLSFSTPVEVAHDCQNYIFWLSTVTLGIKTDWVNFPVNRWRKAELIDNLPFYLTLLYSPCYAFIPSILVHKIFEYVSWSDNMDSNPNLGPLISWAMRFSDDTKGRLLSAILPLLYPQPIQSVKPSDYIALAREKAVSQTFDEFNQAAITIIKLALRLVGPEMQGSFKKILRIRREERRVYSSLYGDIVQSGRWQRFTRLSTPAGRRGEAESIYRNWAGVYANHRRNNEIKTVIKMQVQHAQLTRLQLT